MTYQEEFRIVNNYCKAGLAVYSLKAPNIITSNTGIVHYFSYTTVSKYNLPTGITISFNAALTDKSDPKNENELFAFKIVATVPSSQASKTLSPDTVCEVIQVTGRS